MKKCECQIALEKAREDLRGAMNDWMYRHEMDYTEVFYCVAYMIETVAWSAVKSARAIRAEKEKPLSGESPK